MKYWLVLLIATSFIAKTFGQSTQDSLIQVIHSSSNDKEKLPAFVALAFSMYLSNPDSGILLAQKGFKLAKTQENNFQQASALNALGLSYYRKGWYAKAISCFEQALVLFKTDEDKEQIARVYLNLGHVYQTQKDYRSANAYNIKALRLFEVLNDSFRIALSYQTLNIVCRELGDFDGANDYINKSISILQRLEKYDELANSHTLKGNLLKAQRMFPEAMVELNKAIELYDLANDLSNKGIAYENLGLAYEEINDYTKSIEYLNRSLEIFTALNSEVDQAYERLKRSIPLAKTGDFVAAAADLDFAESIFKKEVLPEYLSEVYLNRSEIFEMQGLSDAALVSFRKHILLKDSLYQSRKGDELLRIKTEFESEQKEKQIEVLQAERDIKNAELTKRNWIIISLATLVLMGISLLYILRNRRKIKDELSKQQLLNKIASDLHDDVGATLSSIRMYSDVIKTKARKEAPELTSIAEKISENATEMIDSMSDIVWTIKPGLDSLLALQDRIWNIGLEMCAPKNIRFNFVEHSESDDFHINTELRHDMYMISKEAINNAVKYSNCTEISIGLSVKNKRLELIIQDNGQGIPLNARRGNGLNNMESRCKEHFGKFEITSNESGTQIHVSFEV